MWWCYMQCKKDWIKKLLILYSERWENNAIGRWCDCTALCWNALLHCTITQRKRVYWAIITCFALCIVDFSIIAVTQQILFFGKTGLCSYHISVSFLFSIYRHSRVLYAIFSLLSSPLSSIMQMPDEMINISEDDVSSNASTEVFSFGTTSAEPIIPPAFDLLSPCGDIKSKCLYF